MTIETDRRRFFRINETLGVAFRRLSDNELPETPLVSDSVQTLAMISGYDNKIETLLSELRLVQPQIGELLDALNRKLNGVIAQLDLDNQLMQQIAHKIQEVNISACGMCFTADQSLAIGDMLALDLLLLPSNLHIATTGKTIACHPTQNADGYHVRVEFSGLKPHDQDVLIQHIARRQVSMIRAQRQQEPR